MENINIVQSLQTTVKNQSDLNVELECNIKSLKEFNLMRHMQQAHLIIDTKTRSQINDASSTQLSEWIAEMEAWEEAGMSMEASSND